MPFPLLFHFLITLTIVGHLPYTTHSTTTTTTTTTCPKLTSPTTATAYTKCTALPTLSSTLHYTYHPSNSTLSVAFTAPLPSPSSYIAYGINPSSTGMPGTQSFVSHLSPSGTPLLSTYNLSSYTLIVPGPLSLKVYSSHASFNAKDKTITIFVTVKSPGGNVNHVWQVGPGVTSTGFPLKHEFKPQNLGSKLTIDVNDGVAAPGSSSGDTSSGSAAAGFGLRKRNTHGILNAISWGILFPFGAIISRYLRAFESADPTWFYLHATCQTSAYAIGVAGWATGLQLGSESKGIVFQGHRCIGIVLFCIATLQIFSLFLRPKKDHKYRLYWNIYHHSIGYAIIILGIINVFKGFDILQPVKKWRSTYVTIIVVLGGIAVLLEVLTWIVVMRRKSSRSTKPYA